MWGIVGIEWHMVMLLASVVVAVAVTRLQQARNTQIVIVASVSVVYVVEL